MANQQVQHITFEENWVKLLWPLHETTASQCSSDNSWMSISSWSGSSCSSGSSSSSSRLEQRKGSVAAAVWRLFTLHSANSQTAARSIRQIASVPMFNVSHLWKLEGISPFPSLGWRKRRRLQDVADGEDKMLLMRMKRKVYIAEICTLTTEVYTLECALNGMRSSHREHIFPCCHMLCLYTRSSSRNRTPRH